MPSDFSFLKTGRTARLRGALTGPMLIALFPALVLAGFWLGGEQMLVMLALGYPLCLLFAVAYKGAGSPASAPDDDEEETAFEHIMDAAVRRALQTSRRTGCILLELDEFPAMRERFGSAAGDAMMTQMAARAASALRTRDTVRRIEDDVLAICIAPVRQLDLGVMLQMAARLQGAIEEPVVIDGATVYVTASVGLALDASAPEATGLGVTAGATTALAEARRHGPSSMRAFSRDMKPPVTSAAPDLIKAATDALENGQIQPWFQPQICTDTGQVSGFEALARWMHPDRGSIAPAEFLPLLEQAGAMERLGEVILYNALSALKLWDAAGLDVPQVGVNFSPEELRNPRLVKKIEWELDRFDLPAHRLNVEILETVVALSPDDTVVRNIAGLSDLGCRIDLDDFGTGHASISSIRRFDVQRLKIDRSIVMKVDRDPEQQRMVSAILTMAEQLGLATLAEGVETAGEHAMMAQLGCGHVQGYGIGRPIPLDQTVEWVTRHLSRLAMPPPIGRQIG
ncbi:putative bifunctional diguanylate cyclase/phosphodiesterase [Roseovarius sp. S4756]|uniref:putative bifunctional diguanylate cyclase/phosphodiesterase n=1 Tax=Roseovarius maritimus TaxID=3342637 RepID=UPI003726E296